MLEEQGIITEIDKTSEGKTVIAVKTAVKTTCGSCAVKSSCGTSSLAEYFTPKSDTLFFETDQSVTVGQTVSLGIREQNVLRASFLVYLLPLIVFICVVIGVPWLFADTVIAHELVTLLLAVLITWGIYVWLQRYLNNQADNFAPQLCHVLPNQVVPKASQISVTNIDESVTKD